MISLSLQMFIKQSNAWLRHIEQGAILIYPTDTIYGLGGIATADVAEKINRIKKRNSTKSFSVIAPDIKWIYEHLAPPAELRDRIAYAQQATTWLIKKKNAKDFYWLSNNDKLGVRHLGSHPIQSFIAALQQPIITTSVNISGASSMTEIEKIDSLISTQVDGIINAGTLTGSPSKLWDCELNRWIKR